MIRYKSPGRWDCDLCPESTHGHPTALFYQLDDKGLSHTVLRAHAAHLDPAKTDPAVIIRHLTDLSKRLRGDGAETPKSKVVVLNA